MARYDAALFDMDGVIVDNHSYHEQAWIAFCKKYGVHLTPDDYKQSINGRTVTEVVQFIFEAQAITPEQVRAYGQEKEAAYRDLYGPHLTPTPGVIAVLEQINKAKVPCAVATSAPSANVDFTLDGLGLRHYFQNIIDEHGVTKGKPDPEIYLKSAEGVGIAPERCLVFEDAISGIKAAQNAGMGVIALATTHRPEELQALNPTAIITDFRDLIFEDWF